MYDLIKELFESYEYKCKEFGNKLLCYRTEEDNKKDFWLVAQLDNIEGLIENQIEWLEQCKQKNNVDELEKNISMLILWNTGGVHEFSEMKKKIMPIEEDPYFFKKHVLYFSPAELSQLVEEIGDGNSVDFINVKVPSNNTFSTFKNNPQAQTWQSLLYRLAIKLPFLDIRVNNTENLGSLFEQNNQKIENHADNLLTPLNSKIVELYDDISLDDLRDKDIVELLENLVPVLSEENDDEH